jgi:hypothetical protein
MFVSDTVGLNTKNLPNLRAKVPVVVSLAFNVNVEVLSLVDTYRQRNCLSTLMRILSTIDASNHIHHTELRADPPSSFNEQLIWATWEEVDLAAWEEMINVLAGPRFQFLRVLHINIGLGSIPWKRSGDDTVVKACEHMVVTHPLLATRDARVSWEGVDYDWCAICSNVLWS